MGRGEESLEQQNSPKATPRLQQTSTHTFDHSFSLHPSLSPSIIHPSNSPTLPARIYIQPSLHTLRPLTRIQPYTPPQTPADKPP